MVERESTRNICNLAKGARSLPYKRTEELSHVLSRVLGRYTYNFIYLCDKVPFKLHNLT